MLTSLEEIRLTEQRRTQLRSVKESSNQPSACSGLIACFVIQTKCGAKGRVEGNYSSAETMTKFTDPEFHYAGCKPRIEFSAFIPLAYAVITPILCSYSGDDDGLDSTKLFQILPR